ncbi:MAG: TetR/AcrR family transcriptional regulator [Syntrophales bacterium]|nr:TetR/AcrR family transcriptional regulator [Syntrophales bacterium]HPL63155.1 TetR/AcrR family transcriptional regulator [Syntrophales bacterium]
MGRKAYFSRDTFLSATMKILTEHGPGGITVAAVAEKAGAPIGSVYHRFSSRDLMLGELWLSLAEEFQRGFYSALKDGGLKAALFTPGWARANPHKAKILLLYRREELMSKNWPREFHLRARRLAQELRREILAFMEDAAAGCSAEDYERTVFALIDAPLAIVRRHLETGRKPPPFMDKLVETTYRAVLEKG